MVRNCVYPGCKNYSTKKGNTFTFVTFPKPSNNLDAARRWANLCQIRVEDIKSYTFVCSLHFPPGANLKLRDNPHLEPFSSREEVPDIGNTAEVTTSFFDDSGTGEISEGLGERPETVEDAQEEESELEILSVSVKKSDDLSIRTYSREKRQSHREPVFLFLPVSNAEDTVSKNLNADQGLVDEPVVEPGPEEECTTDTVRKPKFDEMKDEIAKLKKQLAEVTLQKKVSGIELLAVLDTDEEQFHFYTGSTFVDFQILIDFLGPAMNNLSRWGSDTASSSKTEKRTFTPKQELTLTLIKLRQDLLFSDMAYRYGVHRTTVSRIFTTWIQFMYLKFFEIREAMFPERRVWKDSLPLPFRNEFLRNVRICLDCTEFRCESASDYKQVGNLYSSYKSSTTIKVLIGVSPHGTAVFISSAFEGSITDKETCLQSGLLDWISDGDSVLADRGFQGIEALLVEKGAQLITPPFLQGRKCFTEKEVKLTKVIARSRIHVERNVLYLFRI